MPHCFRCILDPQGIPGEDKSTNVDALKKVNGHDLAATIGVTFGNAVGSVLKMDVDLA